MPPIAKQLPDTDTLRALYAQTGNMEALARHLHTSKWRVSMALHAAGVLKTPLPQKPRKKGNKFEKRECQCESCSNATALRCGYMAASADKAEDVLIRAGVRYRSRVYISRDIHNKTRSITLLTVVECPRYREGSVAV